MKTKKTVILAGIIIVVICSLSYYHLNGGPVISELTYNNITQTGVTVYWTTNIPADSKIRWMTSDSNYQALIFTDSLYNSSAVTNHLLSISSLQPAKIYKYQVTSQNTGGMTIDSGYFVTQSTSSGRVDVYFNHTVDTTVSTGENAKGDQNFETLFLNRIDSAQHSIDITSYELSYYTSISTALINAKNRGVKIRLVYDSSPNTPLIDTLITKGIPVIKRNYDSTGTMHNKFMIFDYRYNTNANTKYLDWFNKCQSSPVSFRQE